MIRTKDAAWTTVCELCGHRLGQHRFGDDACPNLPWRPGGRAWLNRTFRARIDQATQETLNGRNR